MSVALIACEGLTTAIVWPSGVACAVRLMPMVMPAPARWSTTTCWPQASVYFWPSMRTITSEPPPGAVGMMTRMGFVG